MSELFGGSSTLSGGTALERTLDRVTVITAIVWGLCTFWLAWKWTPVAAGSIAREATSEWRNLVDALG